MAKHAPNLTCCSLKLVAYPCRQARPHSVILVLGHQVAYLGLGFRLLAPRSTSGCCRWGSGVTFQELFGIAVTSTASQAYSVLRSAHSYFGLKRSPVAGYPRRSGVDIFCRGSLLLQAPPNSDYLRTVSKPLWNEQHLPYPSLLSQGPPICPFSGLDSTPDLRKCHSQTRRSKVR